MNKPIKKIKFKYDYDIGPCCGPECDIPNTNGFVFDLTAVEGAPKDDKVHFFICDDHAEKLAKDILSYLGIDDPFKVCNRIKENE